MEFRMGAWEHPVRYLEETGKAVEMDGRFRYVMALALDPLDSYRSGVIRCITSREGDVAVSGYIDRSELHRVYTDEEGRFRIGDRLSIQNYDEIVRHLSDNDRLDFLGLEDPDLHHEDGKLHLYFTMPFIAREGTATYTYLGHAEGASLDTLSMTLPVLMTDANGAGAKEVSIVPPRPDGARLNLIESSAPGPLGSFSTVRIAEAPMPSGEWAFGETLFNPGETNIPWIAGHASPGPFIPRSFIDLGPGKLIGFMNGREANHKEGENIAYGRFSVGLFVYDYEQGRIDWVSPEPFISDSEARTITFASQFVDCGEGHGLLYAHVDDAFVRAYRISAAEIVQDL